MILGLRGWGKAADILNIINSNNQNFGDKYLILCGSVFCSFIDSPSV